MTKQFPRRVGDCFGRFRYDDERTQSGGFKCGGEPAGRRGDKGGQSLSFFIPADIIYREFSRKVHAWKIELPYPCSNKVT